MIPTHWPARMLDGHCVAHVAHTRDNGSDLHGVSIIGAEAGSDHRVCGPTQCVHGSERVDVTVRGVVALTHAVCPLVGGRWAPWAWRLKPRPAGGEHNPRLLAIDDVMTNQDHCGGLARVLVKRSEPAVACNRRRWNRWRWQRWRWRQRRQRLAHSAIYTRNSPTKSAACRCFQQASARTAR